MLMLYMTYIDLALLYQVYCKSWNFILNQQKRLHKTMYKQATTNTWILFGFNIHVDLFYFMAYGRVPGYFLPA